MNRPLKNAIDYLHQEWAYKPVGLVSYGGISAGTRAAQMIKQVVTTLKMTPVPEAVSIPFVHQFIGEDGTLSPNDVMVSSTGAASVSDRGAHPARPRHRSLEPRSVVSRPFGPR
jgi:NAD(P)H-dependent FMN reductase